MKWCMESTSGLVPSKTLSSILKGKTVTEVLRSEPRSEPTPSRTITCLSFFLAVNWLTNEWVCLCKFVIELAYALSQTIRKKSNERTSEYLLHKERCIKEQIFFELLYVSYILVHQLSCPKVFFSGMKFRAQFEVVLQKQFRSVVANHSNSDFSTVN